MTTQPFGSHLRELRTAAKVSMGAAARAIGVTTPYYCDVEMNRRKPFPVKRDLYQSLAALFHADLEDLMSRALHARNDLKLEAVDPRLHEIATTLLRQAEMQTLDFDAVLEALSKSAKKSDESKVMKGKP